MKPAFSPILMKTILISEFTFSPCSDTLHRDGFGLNGGSVGGVFGSVPPAQGPPIPMAVATLQIASRTISTYAGALARALIAVPPTRIATRAIAAAYSSVAEPRAPRRLSGASRANMRQ